MLAALFFCWAQTLLSGGISVSRTASSWRVRSRVAGHVLAACRSNGGAQVGAKHARERLQKGEKAFTRNGTAGGILADALRGKRYSILATYRGIGGSSLLHTLPALPHTHLHLYSA